MKSKWVSWWPGSIVMSYVYQPSSFISFTLLQATNGVLSKHKINIKNMYKMPEIYNLFSEKQKHFICWQTYVHVLVSSRIWQNDIPYLHYSEWTTNSPFFVTFFLKSFILYKSQLRVVRTYHLKQTTLNTFQTTTRIFKTKLHLVLLLYTLQQLISQNVKQGITTHLILQHILCQTSHTLGHKVGSPKLSTQSCLAIL